MEFIQVIFPIVQPGLFAPLSTILGLTPIFIDSLNSIKMLTDCPLSAYKKSVSLISITVGFKVST